MIRKEELGRFRYMSNIGMRLHVPRAIWKRFLFASALMLIAGSNAGVMALEYPMLKIGAAAEARKQEEQIAQVGNFLDKAIDAKTYIVGPGDLFRVTVLGATEPIMVEVLPEGIVSIPDIGEIVLGQITLEEAKQRITAVLSSRFRDRSIGVSLAKVRSFKVSVTGGVEKPGIVVVSAADRVSEAIAHAGGLQRKGSQRNIELINIGRDTVIADLNCFNSTGDVQANPYLHEGQVVFVPVVSDSFNRIGAFGAVNSPGSFEFRAGDKVSDLLGLAFGVSVDADRDGGELARFESSGARSLIRVDLRAILADKSSPANFALMPDDRLFIRSLSGFRSKSQVTIVGEVKYPGVYPLEEGMQTLRDLVTKAGGITTEASLTEAEMYRSTQYDVGEQKTGFDRLLQLTTDKLTDFEVQYLKEIAGRRPGKVAVDFELLFGHDLKGHDVTLMDGDWIRIPSKSYSVSVLGRVVNPGLVPYKEGEPVKYYILLAGGYGYKANQRDVRIIKANAGAMVKPDGRTPVAMGDRIMVPQKKAADVWRFVKDAGFFLANLATIYLVINQAVK